MLDFLFSLPLWLLAVVLNAWLMAFALVGLWLVRRHVLPKMRLSYDDAYFAAAVVQSVMMLYGLIAALTAVGVWQKYSQVSDTVSAEASAITSLWRDVGGYPQPLRDATRDILRGYTEQIIRDAWPQQRRRRFRARAWIGWTDFRRNFSRSSPSQSRKKSSTPRHCAHSISWYSSDASGWMPCSQGFRA